METHKKKGTQLGNWLISELIKAAVWWKEGWSDKKVLVSVWVVFRGLILYIF